MQFSYVGRDVVTVHDGINFNTISPQVHEIKGLERQRHGHQHDPIRSGFLLLRYGTLKTIKGATFM